MFKLAARLIFQDVRPTGLLFKIIARRPPVFIFYFIFPGKCHFCMFLVFFHLKKMRAASKTRLKKKKSPYLYVYPFKLPISSFLLYFVMCLCISFSVNRCRFISYFCCEESLSSTSIVIVYNTSYMQCLFLHIVCYGKLFCSHLYCRRVIV